MRTSSTTSTTWSGQKKRDRVRAPLEDCGGREVHAAAAGPAARHAW